MPQLPIRPASARPLSPFFRASSTTKPDILDLVARKPNGLPNITDFEIIQGDKDKAIGAIGFRFKYGQLTYEVEYMSFDGATDLNKFRITVPSESPFLRKSVPPCIAEKIYMLSVIEHFMPGYCPIGHMARLRDACFDKTSGQTDLTPVRPVQCDVVIPVPMFAYTGLSFPNDSDYRNTPDAAVLAFEYGDLYMRHILDLSDSSNPRFLMCDVRNSLNVIPMYQAAAVDFIDRLKSAAISHAELSFLLRMNKWLDGLEAKAKSLPLFTTSLSPRI